MVARFGVFAFNTAHVWSFYGQRPGFVYMQSQAVCVVSYLLPGFVYMQTVCIFATHLTPSNNMAQGKGLTPNKLQYKLLTSRGTAIWASAPYVGLKDCIAGFNTTHTPTKPASYDKAYRELRAFGVYSEVFSCKYNPETMKVETAILVVMPVLGEEVVPAVQTQGYTLEAPGDLFVPAQTLAECGALALSITSKPGRIKLTPGEAISAGTLAYHEFLGSYTLAVGQALAQAAILAARGTSQ